MIFDLLKSALNQNLTALYKTEWNQKRYLPSNFKTARDLRARSCGFDSNAVPPPLIYKGF